MPMVGSVFSAYARSGWLHLTFTHVVFHGMFRNFVQVDRPFQLSLSSKKLEWMLHIFLNFLGAEFSCITHL